MTQSLKILSSYVSSVVIGQLASDSATQPVPDAHCLTGAILFADISGFTPLTEHLAERGPQGAEELARLLDHYFGELVRTVEAYGGDVVLFAGDALLALWAGPLDSLAENIVQACRCALLLRQPVPLPLPESIAATNIQLRIGIAAGELALLRVGGIKERFHALLAGQPIIQACALQSRVPPGEIAFSTAAWPFIQDVAAADLLGDGCMRLIDIKIPTTPLCAYALAQPSLPKVTAAALRGFVPEPVLVRLDSGQSEWLAELRRVTVLFINLLELDTIHSSFLGVLQAATALVQTVADQFEGTVSSVRIDDKGTTLIVVFGFPPFAHEDDAARGTEAALLLQNELQKSGVQCAIGIATGIVFTGNVGSEHRRAYTLHGDIVNLAARLMALQPSGIRCDAGTYRLTHKRLAFETLPAIQLKGKKTPVAVYTPLHRVVAAFRPPPLIGREVERSVVREKLDELVAGNGGVLLFEGEPGIGKSRLLAELLEQAQAKHIPVLAGNGDALETRTPYHVWRTPFAHVLGVEAVSDPAERRRRVLGQLQADEELHRLAPLLNVIISLELPENEITAQMTGQVRADNTHELLVSILNRHILQKSGYLLIILDDAHWFDSASLALLRRINQRLSGILLVIATRPGGDAVPLDYQALRGMPSSTQITLDGLSADAIQALVCWRLGSDKLSGAVAALIQQRAQGNPFYSEELGYALRDAGMLTVLDGVCDFSGNFDKFQGMAVPDTLQGIVTARIDRLAPVQQMTLKVASVIGRVFAYRILHDIYPIATDKQALHGSLETLVRLDLTRLESPEPGLAYIFRHIITQEVTYNLMTFEQRQLLHRCTAQWYETFHAGELSSIYPLMAHHWLMAGNKPKTIDYLEKAGEQALLNSAYQEAAGFFADALKMAADIEPYALPLRKARWERQLGEAHLGLGQLQASNVHLERAMALLGWATPANRIYLLGQLVGEILQQMQHRLWPARFIGRARHAHDRFLEAARARGRLAELYFFAHKKLAMIYAVLQALNLAEAVGPCPELARAYGSICYGAGAVALRSLAEHYGRLARETALRAGDLQAQEWVFEATGFYDLGVASWTRAEKSLQHAIAIADRLGDWRRRDESLGLLLVAAHYQGNFAAALAMSRDVCESARRRGDTQFEIVGLMGQAENLLALGRLQDAAGLLQSALALLAVSPDLTQEMKAYGLLASAAIRIADVPLALQAAGRCVQMIRKRLPMAAHAREAYAGPAEVFLTLWESGERQYAGSAWRACTALSRFARIFPIGRPRSLLYGGLLHWLQGRHKHAYKEWQKSRAEAERLEMSYEQGLAELELGRHLPADDKARCGHLQSASELFARLDAAFDLQRAQSIRKSGMA